MATPPAIFSMQIRDLTTPGAYHVQIQGQSYLLEVWPDKGRVLWGELSELKSMGDKARVVSSDAYRCRQLDQFNGAVLQTLEVFKP